MLHNAMSWNRLETLAGSLVKRPPSLALRVSFETASSIRSVRFFVALAEVARRDFCVCLDEPVGVNRRPAHVALSLRDRRAERFTDVVGQLGFPVAERQGYVDGAKQPLRSQRTDPHH